MKFMEAWEIAESRMEKIYIQTPEMMNASRKRMTWIALNPNIPDFYEVDPRWRRGYCLDIHDLKRDDWEETEYKRDKYFSN